MNQEECLKLADKLHEMQKNKYEGRGVSVVKSIIFYLRRGQADSARAVCRNECDKFYGIDDIKQVLKHELFFGKNHPWKFSDP